MTLKKEFLKYFISGGIGLVLNTPFLIWITDAFGKQITQIEVLVPAYTIAYWISYGLVGCLEFTLRKFWVFKSSQHPVRNLP